MNMQVLSAVLEWDGQEFVNMPITKDINDDPKKTLIFLDEGTRTIIFRMGSEVGAIDKRIISRRFQSISKSGIQLNGINLGIGYNVIEHVGDLNLRELIKDPEKGLSTLSDSNISMPISSMTKPLPAERTQDASSTLTGHNKEALELGLKILKHVENNRMVIVDSDKSVRVFTKFL